MVELEWLLLLRFRRRSVRFFVLVCYLKDVLHKFLYANISLCTCLKVVYLISISHFLRLISIDGSFLLHINFISYKHARYSIRSLFLDVCEKWLDLLVRLSIRYVVYTYDPMHWLVINLILFLLAPTAHACIILADSVPHVQVDALVEENEAFRIVWRVDVDARKPLYQSGLADIV